MKPVNKLLYIDTCTNDKYNSFIDYAIDKNDFFMLVYVNYYNKGLSRQAKNIKSMLKPLQVKKRTNPSWPGTPKTYCNNTTYQVIFYHTHPDAKEILKSVNSLANWTSPSFPQDIAFFKGNICWLYSVGHENIFALINPDVEDIEFLKKINLFNNDNLVNSSTYYTEKLV